MKVQFLYGTILKGNYVQLGATMGGSGFEFLTMREAIQIPDKSGPVFKQLWKVVACP